MKQESRFEATTKSKTFLQRQALTPSERCRKPQAWATPEHQHFLLRQLSSLRNKIGEHSRQLKKATKNLIRNKEHTLATYSPL
jgi:hypothetical protein